MWISLWVAATLLFVLSALPLCRIEAWWVRGLDFPRLQLALVALLLWGLELALLDFGRLGSWALMGLTVVCLGFQAWWIWPYTRLHSREVKTARKHDPDNRIAIMTANVLASNRRADDLLALVREHRPDILVTLESDHWWQSQLDALEPDYPHTIKCPLDNLYGMHVYSRYRLDQPEIQFLVQEDVPSMHAEVVLPSGARVAVHFVHPAPPSPTENDTSSERDAELLVVGRSVADLKVPVIVTGDLNDVAWSSTTRLFRKISGLLDPRIGRGMFNSFHAGYPFVRWPLDHLFHSEHFALEQLRRLPAFGSDHFPVFLSLIYRGDQRKQGGLEADADDLNEAREKMADESVSPGEVHHPESVGA
ncbi:endonuclease/exonuclease/phosphatase family protein [Marinimicrobium sp. C2-29]|uniref:endonuclease/exonuclease/phosphatase family protein n=1 Tax=Marinimicrobium sp. C2-29 TaxID=3139825 RepID=UPI00313A20EC